MNVFLNDELIAWIERRLDERGVAKIIPDDDTLADAYRRMRRQALVQERIDNATEEMGAEAER